MQGAGNDYIYVNVIDHPLADPSQKARLWSDRHKGIGSDGLVLIGLSPVPEADYTMRIFNADGSEAMMCGNASRCIGKFIYERGLSSKTTLRLLTLSGVKTLTLHLDHDLVESVTVDMGEPVFDAETQFLPQQAPSLSTLTDCHDGAAFVSMGNPHYVVFTDDIEQVSTLGPSLECHPAFPQRCNIEFVRLQDDGSLRVRVWERGSGITMACGTGACATAVAASRKGLTGRQSTIVMDGGTLSVEWRETDNHVYMTGPATFVFDGEIEI